MASIQPPQLGNVTQQLILQSKAQLRGLYEPSILWVAFSAVNFITCSATIFVILLSKQLRSIYYNNLLHQSLADTILCGVIFAIGLKRVVLVVTDGHEVTRMIDCAGWVVIMTGMLNISASQTATMAFMRGLALLAPVKYYLLEPKYSHAINGFFWLLGIAVGAIIQAGNKGTGYATMCLYGAIYEKWALDVGNYVQLCWSIVNVAICIGLAGLLYVRTKGARSAKELQVELKATRTVVLMATRYALFSVLPYAANHIANAVAVSQGQQGGAKSQFFVFAVVSFGCSMNLFLYYFTDTQFRAAAKRLTRTLLLKGRVEPSDTSATN